MANIDFAQGNLHSIELSRLHLLSSLAMSRKIIEKFYGTIE